MIHACVRVNLTPMPGLPEVNHLTKKSSPVLKGDSHLAGRESGSGLLSLARPIHTCHPGSCPSLPDVLQGCGAGWASATPCCVLSASGIIARAMQLVKRASSRGVLGRIGAFLDSGRLGNRVGAFFVRIRAFFDQIGVFWVRFS